MPFYECIVSNGLLSKFKGFPHAAFASSKLGEKIKNILVLQHIECEGLGSLEGFLKSRGALIDYRRLADGDSVPKNLSHFSALISLGGPMNVYEEEKYPILKEEGVLLRLAIDRDFPTLGVCLGAQLIAKNVGVSVTQGSVKEIGWFSIQLTEQGKGDPLFEGLPLELSVFQWHGDTFEIPHQGVNLAKSKLFSNQAFRLKKNIFGLQFHIEITDSMIRDWIKNYPQENIDAGKILNDTTDFMASLEKTAHKIYENLWRIWNL